MVSKKFVGHQIYIRSDKAADVAKLLLTSYAGGRHNMPRPL